MKNTNSFFCFLFFSVTLTATAVSKLLEGTPRQVRESLISRSVRILACYRKLCANPSSPGQLILPECMKLLPLYVNCLLKSDAISGGKFLLFDSEWKKFCHIFKKFELRGATKDKMQNGSSAESVDDSNFQFTMENVLYSEVHTTCS